MRLRVAVGLLLFSIWPSGLPDIVRPSATLVPVAASKKVWSRTPASPQFGDTVLTETVVVRRGTLELYEQRVDGVRVLGGETVVRRDERGEVVWHSGRARAVGSVEFVLTPDEAVDALGGPRVPVLIDPVILAVGPRRARAAYRIVLAPELDGRTQWRAFVDARSGALLGRENLVRSAQGHVYEVDPLSTPELSSVDLPTAGATLENERFVIGNCVDDSTCIDVYPSMCRLGCQRASLADMNDNEIAAIIDLANSATVDELDHQVRLDSRAATNIVARRNDVGAYTFIEELDDVAYVAETAFGKMLSYAYASGRVPDTQIHFCDTASLAAADGAGDFFFAAPADSDGADPFVEVHLFHHLNLVDDVVREWGFDGLGQRVQVIGNYTDADEYDPASRSCTNGVFTGEQALSPVDNAWFAPTQLAGEPVLVFGQGEEVDWGLDADIVYHEYGHALMFDVAPDVGSGTWDEYGFDRSQAGLHEGFSDLVALWMSGDPAIGRYVATSWGAESLRDLSEPARCPEDMTGEEHDDGLILPSAFWHARAAVEPDARSDFDESAFVVWQSLGIDDGLQSTVDRLLAEFGHVRPDQADAARAVFDEFLTPDCLSRTVDAWAARDLTIQGSDYYDAPPYGVPHTLQFRGALSTDATSFTFAVAEVEPSDPASPADITLFMKFGADPIRWVDTVDGYVNDADVSAGVQVDDGVAWAELGGNFPAGTYTFAIANRGGSATLWGTSFDTDGTSLKADDVVAPNASDESAGCATQPGRPDMLPLWLVAAVVALSRRRRRRVRADLGPVEFRRSAP